MPHLRAAGRRRRDRRPALRLRTRPRRAIRYLEPSGRPAHTPSRGSRAAAGRAAAQARSARAGLRLQAPPHGGRGSGRHPAAAPDRGDRDARAATASRASRPRTWACRPRPTTSARPHHDRQDGYRHDRDQHHFDDSRHPALHGRRHGHADHAEPGHRRRNRPAHPGTAAGRRRWRRGSADLAVGPRLRVRSPPRPLDVAAPALRVHALAPRGRRRLRRAPRPLHDQRRGEPRAQALQRQLAVARLAARVLGGRPDHRPEPGHDAPLLLLAERRARPPRRIPPPRARRSRSRAGRRGRTSGSSSARPPRAEPPRRGRVGADRPSRAHATDTRQTLPAAVAEAYHPPQSEMVELGLALAVIGAALLVAEAHVPGGVLGVFGGMALAGGAALAIARRRRRGRARRRCHDRRRGRHRSMWLAVAARKSLAARRRQIASGRETLSGRTGVVRTGPATAVRCSWTARSGAPAAAGWRRRRARRRRRRRR